MQTSDSGSRLGRLAAQLQCPAAASAGRAAASYKRSGRGTHEDEWCGTAPASRSWDGTVAATGSPRIVVDAAQISTDHDVAANSAKICTVRRAHRTPGAV